MTGTEVGEVERGQVTQDTIVRLTGGPCRVAYRRQLRAALALILNFILRIKETTR